MRHQDFVHSDNYPTSYYAASANQQPVYPRLSEHKTVDVCIIGGGFTGLAAALELAERNYRVCLLEARKVGWGASGRNGGQLIRGIGHSAEPFRALIGQEGIDAIWQMGIEAVEIVKERVNKYQIDCDLTWGYFDAANKPKYLRQLADYYQASTQRNYPYPLKWISQTELSTVIGTNCYIGGLVDMGSGHLHPLNLCLGEAIAATQLGVEIYEKSPVTAIEPGLHPTVKTPYGQVKANAVVVGCNAYLGQLVPQLAGKVLPAGSYIIATEPLTDSLAQQLLPQNMAVSDQRITLDYFRLSADKRLLFGGLCHYSGQHPSNIHHALRPNMLKVFPQLASVKIDYQWGGNIGIGANRMPQLGILDQNIYYAQAYSGHGLNATHMMGRLIAEALSGQLERFDVFAKIKHITFPGGPLLRSPLLALGMLYYRLKDYF
ncbi:FAD-binding oxidoreductase [Endozoicomonas sp. SM1973]|uniref:FAD-binding oxidoreductase n=1 Tax=Spartinivicinus marinus TaxID=2994442 RepID=A0A853HUK8_9GAMM|nr:FAD-binding oxidoreductase [Spartinivicinus marinus]MCX4028967.1 FAD-binding oxidoreductase [Spartinivicinus marinus]NYZ65450.1 FAD-binding oxidoreductase [Spartinivicinus marinus]